MHDVRAMMDYMAAKTIPIETRLKNFSRLTSKGCREWTGAIVRGYGYIQMGSRALGTRRVAKVHRLAWEMANGPIPLGMFVCHHCDNKRCFAVRHLFLGGARDNTMDAAAKGRLNRKLTPDAVREIRRLLGFGVSHRHIAARAGVAYGTIQAIADGRTHVHVT